MIRLNVNGRSFDTETDPDTPLLYFLRNELELNGAKFGCGLGQCGACTVLVEGQPIFSCLTPIRVLAGRQITTVEGIGTIDNPGAVQVAFIEEQAAQCGYCTAGMIMRVHGLLLRDPAPSDQTIRRELDPVLCRCGSYLRILKAVRRAADRVQSSARTQGGAT